MRIVGSCSAACPSLEGYTLIVPGCGGLAQLGELCVDALIASFGLECAAVAEVPLLLPCVGACAFNSSGGATPLTTAAEVYLQPSRTQKLAVLQMRSPPIPGRRRALAADIISWASSVGVVELIVVAPCSAHVKGDVDLAADSQLRFVRVGSKGGCTPEAPEGDKDGSAALPLGHSLSPEQVGMADVCPDGAQAAYALLRGSGLALPLLECVAREESSKTPGVLCLLGLTSGLTDLRIAATLATFVGACVQARTGAAWEKLQTPPSWFSAHRASQPTLWG